LSDQEREPQEALRSYEQVLRQRPKDSEAAAGRKRVSPATKSPLERERARRPSSKKRPPKSQRREKPPETESPPPS
ncbi:MAG: hypothetical protein L3J78_04175, partial [Thermoplasmata archaeon]|nr:hypothetical protein [Thermoplasmata archaeon]